MIGLDTNVLVRYLTQDDPTQARKANRLIEEAAAQGERLHIDVIVLCELVWVLGGAYGFDRQTMTSSLQKMLEVSQFSFEDKDLVRAALLEYARGKGDLADYLLGARGRQLGCQRTVTFDRALKSSELFSVL